ncbi:MAG TPA: FtsX-like permease family protein [Blastocatellia bacterium]|nr:FtsX-like permease family protein [Blastocatellia bacterium]
MKYGKLILKNVFRNVRRTVLTISSLAVSLFLIVTLATVVTEFTRGSSEANPLRLVTGHAMSLGLEIPIAYQSRIAAVPGVKVAIPYNWFGGEYKDPQDMFANFSVDAKLLREYQPELKMSDAQWSAFVDDRQGAIVGIRLADKYNWKIGDRVTLRSPIYRVSPEFIIRGIYSSGDEKVMFFHYEYVNEMESPFFKDKVSTFGIVANSIDDTTRIPRAVDAMFVNSDAPTKTESEREFAISFQSMMGNFQTFIYAIIGAIIFSLMLVVANSMSMSVRERTKEVGTLKALGFQRGAITWLFIGESLLLAITGSALGIGGAVLLYHAKDFSAMIPFMQSFVPTNETVLLSFVTAVLIGVLSVTYSALRVSGLTIAEALRRVE